MKASAHGQLPPPIKKQIQNELQLEELSAVTLSNKSQKKLAKSRYNSLMVLNSTPKWTRKPDDPCKIPNKLKYRIEAGQKGSFAIKFSNNGIFLAVASVDQTSYPIKIYQFETGDRFATLDGHQDLVYSLFWSDDDSELISASSDGSVRIWGFMADGSVQQTALLLHPCFVYCAALFPDVEEVDDDQRMVATGSFDGCIRLWKYQKQTRSQSSAPFMKLVGHDSNVNSICFNKDGSRLYSGDANGNIKIWSEVDKKFECIKTVELNGAAIQTLQLHVSNRKLLVQTAGPSLHLFDTRIHRFLTHFKVINEQNLPTYPTPFGVDQIPRKSHNNQFLRSCFSACGGYIFAGSSTGQVYIWKTESGTFVGSYDSKHPGWIDGTPVVDVAFHPHENAIAFASWGAKEPVKVFGWSESTPQVAQVSQTDPEPEKSTYYPRWLGHKC